MRHQMSFLLLLLLPLLAVAQPTTEEEYNYLSRGYKIQVESGLDMKKGYSIRLLDATAVTLQGTEVKAEYSGLYRDGSESPCAILVTVSKVGSRERGYLAIPSHDAPKEMWDRAFEDLNNRFGSDQHAMGVLVLGFMHFATLEASRGGPSLYRSERAVPRVVDDNIDPVSGCSGGRTLVKMGVPKPGASEAGLVMVDVWIDRAGNVVRAQPRTTAPTNTTSRDLLTRATEAARHCKFSPSSTAPAEQRCEVPFRFSFR